MQIKTINRTIKKKLEEWLETITDISLRNEVKKNIVVSGGCITNLFLNEPINDYDVYIKDMDVLIRLAKYYFGSDVLDGRLKEQYLETRREQCERNGEYSEDSDHAENIVRIKTLKEDQVKLNISSQGIRYDKKENEKYYIQFASQNAISLSDDIQIVLRFHGTVEEIHKTFDFKHATNYFTFETGVVTNTEALECILTKTLKYQGSLYPLTSIIRIKKFLKRGWAINAGEMLKIMFQLSELDLTNIETLEEQLIGVDVAYFSTLIEILRGVEKEKLTSDYLNTIIDRVFNQYEERDDQEII